MVNDSLRSLSSDIVVISIALLGVIFILIALIWKKFILSIVSISIYWRMQYLKLLLLIFIIPLLVPLAVYTAIGVYFPSFAQSSILLVMMLIAAMLLLYSLFHAIRWTINRIRGVKRPRTKLDGEIILCWQSAFCLGLSAICSLIALLGCSSSALNIFIGPYQTENFNWSRWLLNDAILLFIIATIQTGFLFMTERNSKALTKK
jgi:hypothetical protein